GRLHVELIRCLLDLPAQSPAEGNAYLRELVEDGDGLVVLLGDLEEQRMSFSTLVQHADATLDRIFWFAWGVLLPPHLDLACSPKVRTVDQARELGAPGADQADHPDDLPGADSETRRTDQLSVSQATHGQYLLAKNPVGAD